MSGIKGLKVTLNTIKEDVVNELHKPARKKYKRRRVIVKGLNDLWQADLVEMQPYAKFNRGYRYILVVINVFSKYVWALPVKSKTSKNVSAAMEKILNEVKNNPKSKQGVPKNIQSDRGLEFYAKDFKKLMETFNINHYSTFSNMKASIVERVNRTLKNKMWKQFSVQGSYKWLKLLPEIVNKYNNTIHSVIRKKPIDVNKRNEKELLKYVYTHKKVFDSLSTKYRVGDYVRISKQREAFTKGYTPSWSNEVFHIKKVNLTNPTTYLLQDENGLDIEGGFYTEELQKVKHKDVYLVEKILRRKGNQVLVKWLGMNKDHNSWISKTDVL